MIYKVTIIVTYKKSVLEPQGQSVLLSLKENNIHEVVSSRIGKHIELEVKAESKEIALELANKIADQFLCNSVMENFKISIQEK